MRRCCSLTIRWCLRPPIRKQQKSSIASIFFFIYRSGQVPKIFQHAKMNHALHKLTSDPRITIRRAGSPAPDGCCVVYWMQRAQRGRDNPALDVAVNAANALGKPIVVFFAPRPFPPANLRHYAFLAQGIPDIAEALEKRNIGFVLRRFPDHSLVRFCDQINPSLVVGDENPIRQDAGWRDTVAEKLKLPLWTVDGDVIVPSKLLEKAQYAAHTIRPRIQARLKQFLVASPNPKAKIPWTKPRSLQSLLPANINLDDPTDEIGRAHV